MKSLFNQLGQILLVSGLMLSPLSSKAQDGTWAPSEWNYLSYPFVYSWATSQWYYLYSESPLKDRPWYGEEIGLVSDRVGWHWFDWPSYVGQYDETGYLVFSEPNQFVFDYSVWAWRDLTSSHITLPSKGGENTGGGENVDAGEDTNSNVLSNGDRLFTTQTWVQFGETITEEREALVRIMGDPSAKLPVVFLYHATISSPEDELSFWDHLDNVILVAPRGHNTAWNATDESSEAPDVAFTEDLLAQLEAFTNVDIYDVTLLGYSNGSALVNRMMIELPGVVPAKAITLSSPLNQKQYRDGRFYYSPNGDEAFNVAINPPYRRLLTVSGDQDELVPYYGGPDIDGFQMLAADYSAYVWAQNMGYTGAQIPSGSGVSAFGDAVRYDYGDVQHYRLIGGNHGLETNGNRSTLHAIVNDFLSN